MRFLFPLELSWSALHVWLKTECVGGPSFRWGLLVLFDSSGTYTAG